MIVSVMKTGTNQLHGSGEDRYLNKQTLHRRYFDQLEQPPFSYHDLTGTLGGPVTIPKIYNGKDRTFWFFGWQRQNERASESATSSVPTPEMLNGDFSFLNTLGPNGGPFQLYDPYSTRLTNPGGPKLLGTGSHPGKQDSPR